MEPSNEIMRAHTVLIDTTTGLQVMDVPGRPRPEEYKDRAKFTVQLERWAHDNEMRNRTMKKEEDRLSATGRELGDSSEDGPFFYPTYFELMRRLRDSGA